MILTPGQTSQLTLHLGGQQPINLPVGATLSWSSDNPAAFTVSATGLVTAVGVGQGHAKATVSQPGVGDKKENININVQPTFTPPTTISDMSITASVPA